MLARHPLIAVCLFGITAGSVTRADDRALAGVREYPAGVIRALVALAEDPLVLAQLAEQPDALANPDAARPPVPTRFHAAARALSDAPLAVMIAADHTSRIAALRRAFADSPQRAHERLVALRERFDAEEDAAFADWRERLANDAVALGEYRDLLTGLTRELFADVSNPPVVVVLDRSAYAACPPNEYLIDALIRQAESRSLQAALRQWWERHAPERREDRAMSMSGSIAKVRGGRLPVVSTGPARRWRELQPTDDLKRLDLLPVMLLPREEMDAAARAERAAHENARLWRDERDENNAGHSPADPVASHAPAGTPADSPAGVTDWRSAAALPLDQPSGVAALDFSSSAAADAHEGVFVSDDRRRVQFSGNVSHAHYLEDDFGFQGASYAALPGRTVLGGTSVFGGTAVRYGGACPPPLARHYAPRSFRSASAGCGHFTGRCSCAPVRCDTPRFSISFSTSGRRDCDRGPLLRSVFPGYVSAASTYYSLLGGRDRDCDRSRYTRPYVTELNPNGYPLPGNPRAAGSRHPTHHRIAPAPSRGVPPIQIGPTRVVQPARNENAARIAPSVGSGSPARIAPPSRSASPARIAPSVRSAVPAGSAPSARSAVPARSASPARIGPTRIVQPARNENAARVAPPARTAAPPPVRSALPARSASPARNPASGVRSETKTPRSGTSTRSASGPRSAAGSRPAATPGASAASRAAPPNRSAAPPGSRSQPRR
ncbi:MAG: hypothetical protein HRU75_07930 [Planctomycetia bacterium]|nr:MAG: hypothetical protein HRU75_07930 [Planctomycetia bacterium]